MNNIEKIRKVEKKYEKMLYAKLKGDSRLSLSCPDFKYPEPIYFYVKSVKTEKSLAVRIDGEDNTIRFWDYVDDGYEGEDGVWAKMTETGFERFIKKLYAVMDSAVDIEFYGEDGITDDYYAGVIDGELDEEVAKKLLKKHGAGVDFIFAKISDFYGEKQFVFDKRLNSVGK